MDQEPNENTNSHYSSDFDENLEMSRTKMHEKPKKPKKKRWILRIFLFLLFLGIIGVATGAGIFYHYAKDAPKLTDAELMSTASSRIYAANNELLYELGNENRELISASEIPQMLNDAIVSIEDRRYYKHIGIDPIRIVGAAFANLKSGDMTGQGGSTITQQLIKLSYFSTSESDKKLERKVQEAWLSIELERKKSKEEILTYYINKVYMSNGLYGMETAAKAFYGKNLKDLSLPQTALLAGIPQAPSDYDPYANQEQSKKRRDLVLEAMKENKKITAAECEAAKNVPIEDGLQPINTNSEERKVADNYLSEVIKEATDKIGPDFYTRGVDIYTNIDMDAQRYLYELVNNSEAIAFPDDNMQAAVTVLDVKTGQVKAQIGSRKVDDSVQFGLNLATSNERYDIGSTMKPIADYAPAIEYLNYSTGRIIRDNKYFYKSSPDKEVNNYDFRHLGAITLRTALINSRNVPAVKTLNAVGIDKAQSFLEQMDITFSDGQNKQMQEANAISGYLSTLQLAASYAAFADNGLYHKPYYINKITYQDGSEETYQAEEKRVMKDSTAYMITDVLKDVISQGTGTNAFIPGMIQAGKTGTSNYDKSELVDVVGSKAGVPDITFAGYTTDYSIAVWTGYKKRKEAIAPGKPQMLASDIYRELMTYMMREKVPTDWTMPEGVIQIGSELYVKGHTTGQYETTSYSYIPETAAPASTSSSSSSSESSSESTQTEPPASATAPPEPPVASTAPPEPPAASEGG